MKRLFRGVLPHTFWLGNGVGGVIFEAVLGGKLPCKLMLFGENRENGITKAVITGRYWARGNGVWGSASCRSFPPFECGRDRRIGGFLSQKRSRQPRGGRKLNLRLAAPEPDPNEQRPLSGGPGAGIRLGHFRSERQLNWSERQLNSCFDRGIGFHSLRRDSRGLVQAARRAGMRVAVQPTKARTRVAARMASELALTEP